MTIVETRVITGGVDTHLDVHVAAALDAIGGELGVESFPTTPAGYAALTDWLMSFGTVERVGVEGTGSYGAGLARHLHAAGVTVIEINRADRAARRAQGKSDPLDALSAARTALSRKATGSPKGRDGQVEAIRALMVTKRSTRRDRTATINQMRAMVLSGPDDLRTRFAHHTTALLIAEAAVMRPRTGEVVGYTTRTDQLARDLIKACPPTRAALPWLVRNNQQLPLDNPYKLRSGAAATPWSPSFERVVRYSPRQRRAPTRAPRFRNTRRDPSVVMCGRVDPPIPTGDGPVIRVPGSRRMVTQPRWRRRPRPGRSRLAAPHG